MKLILSALVLAALCPAHEIETAGSARMEFSVENGPHANPRLPRHLLRRKD